MKKFRIVFTILAVFLFLMTFSACDSLKTLPEKTLPPYPNPSADSGYSVSGKITDKSGNSLPGVALYIGNEVRALTDANGNYRISGLNGDVKIKPTFYSYTFNSNELAVSGATSFDFVGQNKYTVAVSYSTPNGASLYGIACAVGNKAYAADSSGTVFVDNLNGKTTVTPISNNFDFSPSSQDVYSSSNVSFTATPKSGTFSVSGTIDTSLIKKDETVPQVFIAVNGKKYCDVVYDYVYDADNNMQTVMKYTVYGLANNPKTAYKITLIDGEGNPSRESYSVTATQKNLNFTLQLTRKINLQLVPAYPSDPAKVIPVNDYDYRVSVRDAQNVEVRGGWESEEIAEGITVWEGAIVRVTGTYKTAGGIMMEYDEVLKVTARMMRETETLYEITYYPYVYESHE